ncbi:cyclic-AMP receptor protein [Niveomyces insectorum RCEF 264]|uniref:Cyclic-AMP receptor protein n=1 Tax=Niveomyces insectorum RCEF 264 TaxID=1081102 RepID=A0A167P4Z1_9HYPO|nr:cyclic-AMP receptor protein [Niveomyces insectorum RCEF 264]
MALSAEHLRALEIVERCASALSILGILTVIVTFFSSRYFRNPIDRLILINAFYNIFDITATMISLSGPSAGNGSALCRFQGFLMQMFPLADVLWTLAMAWDVFLIVFYQYDAKALRMLERKYIAGITILTFIPAFAFIFVHTAEKGHMYGSVTLWCAIAPDWILFRIIFYYGPIWLVIVIVMVLYCLVGWKIVKGKRALKSVEGDVIPLETRSSEKDSSETGHVQPRPGPAASRSALSLRQYILMPVLFFVVLLAIWVAPSTNRVASFVDPSYVSFPLYLAVGSTGSLRGFWNGVVFITVGMRSRQSQKRLEERRPWRQLH